MCPPRPELGLHQALCQGPVLLANSSETPFPKQQPSNPQQLKFFEFTSCQTPAQPLIPLNPHRSPSRWGQLLSSHRR